MLNTSSQAFYYKYLLAGLTQSTTVALYIYQYLKTAPELGIETCILKINFNYFFYLILEGRTRKKSSKSSTISLKAKTLT